MRPAAQGWAHPRQLRKVVLKSAKRSHRPLMCGCGCKYEVLGSRYPRIQHPCKSRSVTKRTWLTDERPASA